MAGCYFEQFQKLRQIVDDQWRCIPDRFSAVLLDTYVIMPNHLHGILVICRGAGIPDCGTSPLGEIVGVFKSLCVDDWLKVIRAEQLDAKGKFWQANYYEHVIRSDSEMDRIREYIANNPLQWDQDRENPKVDRRTKQILAEKWMV